MWYYGPFLISRSDVILKLGQKSPKFVYLVLLVEKGQNQQVMNHLDEENVYETNFKVFKTLTLIMTSLTANWVEKDLNL